MNHAPQNPSSAREWAVEIFGNVKLGNIARERNLVALATQLATNPAAAVARLAHGTPGRRLAFQRLLGNPHVEPDAIRDAAAASVAERVTRVVRDGGTVLVPVDTTTLSFRHALADELGLVGGPAASTTGGWIVNTALATGRDRRVHGLIDLQWWTRDRTAAPTRANRKQRDYADKESAKFSRSRDAVLARLPADVHTGVIFLVDREGDVHEFLQELVQAGTRFVVRGAYDRALDKEAGALRTVLAKARVAARFELTVPARGRSRTRKPPPARSERTVTLECRARQVTLGVSQATQHPQRAPVTVNAVLVRETGRAADEPGEPLNWLLLTSEPVDSAAAVRQVVDDYTHRWRIEEFHKAWKNGCAAEARKQQLPENMLRLQVVLAFVATRVMELHALTRERARDDDLASTVFDADEVQLLLAVVAQQGVPRGHLPPPHRASQLTLRVALVAVAKLGGWLNTKGNGAIGFQTMWSGWTQFELLLRGYRLARPPRKGPRRK